jgi:hypothetical protein
MTTKSFHGKNLTSLSGFRGVDFSSSPLDVDGHRASDMENFVSDFGILKKRNGFRQIREFSDREGNRLSVCGIFHYTADDVSHVIVHAGDRFFRLTENGYERIGASIEGLTATRSEAYMQKGRMYIVGCGDLLVYGSFDGGVSYELKRVTDKGVVYIPTTTANISSAEHAVLGDDRAIDEVNLLTPWRKNTLNGVVVKQTSETTTTGEAVEWCKIEETFYLDALVDVAEPITLRVIDTDETLVFHVGSEQGGNAFYTAEGDGAGVSRIDLSGSVVVTFDNENDVPTEPFEMSSIDGPFFKCEDGIIYLKYGNSYVKYGVYTIDGRVLTLTKTGELYASLYAMEFYVAGFVLDTRAERTLSFENGASCRFSLLDASFTFSFNRTATADRFADIAYGDGEEVFEVSFCAVIESEEGVVPYRERIGGCRFGTVFGVDGASDRLFLTGNPRMKNVEFFSQVDDYSYFPDTSTVTVGSNDAAIVGYLRLSDGTLAVFKEKKDMGEATIYYRTGRYQTYTDEDGDLDRIDAVFTTVAGNMGEAMISRFASRDFGGDKLFLSENGVFAVTLSENIVVGERYSRERSRRINARLTKEAELGEACAIVHKNKYYLALNGNVYVADARYRSTHSDNMDSAWGYEWYFLSGIPARVLAEVDGTLWFGTEDGRLCLFDDQYTDRTYTLYAAADLTASREGITVNGTIDPPPRVGDSFSTNNALYGVAYKGFCSADGMRVYCEDPALVARMAEGERVYMHGAPEGSSLENGALYEIRGIDLLEGCFSLYKDGFLVPADTAEFSLLCSLWGVELDVTEAEGSHFKVGRWGETMELVTEELTVLTGRLWHKRPVRARWVSSVTALGAPMASKNLHRLSITCEPVASGELVFGYDARLSARRMAAPGMLSPLSFETFDFSKFTFETGFASSYTARIFERGVNYLALAVESSTATGCAFNSIEVLWSYNRVLNNGLR